MQKKIYGVYDEKTEMFNEPYYSFTDAQAKRAFTDAVNDPGHPFGMHPADYTLFRLGTLDTSTGVITAEKNSLGNGVEFRIQD